ncbi:hypothetical protein BP6252_02465 [Coleophoma cylindrospora]|uniref:Major facilitator superfamily (MFS) profile domain-containing protein n=1 Tax=Coleophoma cylindrospora TaxID=1849047 RepID=A0A3D8SEV8_9HELO|nr:hypothetical protein BP6252_02465 [Coleophoma cylindrospora]
MTTTPAPTIVNVSLTGLQPSGQDAIAISPSRDDGRDAQLATGDEVTAVEDGPASTRESKTKLAIIVASLWASYPSSLGLRNCKLTRGSLVLRVPCGSGFPLPTITQHFNSSAGYTWIGSAYLLATAASTPSWGKFSDIWGRKPILLTAVAVFFIGSLLCGAASSIFLLIAGRAVQGIGGGGILTLVNICQSDLFSLKNRVLVFAFESLIWAGAAAGGPILGGVFAELWSWRWCFYINLPAAGSAFIVLLIFLDLKSPKTPLLAGLKAVDWLGSLAVVGTTVSVLLGLEFGGTLHHRVIFSWSSAKVLCLILSGCFMGALFLYNEAKIARYPLMPLRLFRNWNNVAALSVGFLHSLTYISTSYYIPMYTQSVLSLSPLQAGINLLPFALALPLSAALTGPFLHFNIPKFPINYTHALYFGILLLTLGQSLLITLSPSTSRAHLFIFQVLNGIGAGVSYTMPLIALQTGVESSENATATATLGFLRNLATAISVVLGGVVFQNGMQSQSQHLTQVLGPDIAGLLSGKTAAANILAVQNQPLDAVQRLVVRQAYTKALKGCWILYAGTAGATLVASVFVRRRVLSEVLVEVEIGLHSEEKRRLEAHERGRSTVRE